MLAILAPTMPLFRKPAVLLGVGAAAVLMTAALCCPSPVPSTTAQAGADAVDLDLWPVEVRSAASGAKGYPLEEPPSGPDMTLAEATGMPMADGVSADPVATLLDVVSQQQTAGSLVEVVAFDSATGQVVYA